MRRHPAAVACALVLSLVTGCSLQTLGAMKGNLHLQARFTDVQNLVPGEAVEISDVQVGSIIAIHLHGYEPVVTMAVRSNQKIPVGTTAVLNQVSLLGEQYVDLQLPAHYDPIHGPWLVSGAVLPTASTQGLEQFVDQATSVVGALDAGDLAATLHAMDQALAGRGPELHQMISDLTQVGAAIHNQEPDIVAVINGLAELGGPLAAGSDQIGRAITALAAATGVIAADRQKLMSSLTQLTRLAGDLNSQVLAPHLQQIETLLAQLDPVLGTVALAHTQLAAVATNLRAFIEQIPKAIYNSTILFYAWFAGTVTPGGATHPLPAGSLLQNLVGPHG